MQNAVFTKQARSQVVCWGGGGGGAKHTISGLNQWRSQYNTYIVGHTLPDAGFEKAPPGEGVRLGRGAPCRPAKGYVGALQAPPSRLGEEP